LGTVIQGSGVKDQNQNEIKWVEYIMGRRGVGVSRNEVSRKERGQVERERRRNQVLNRSTHLQSGRSLRGRGKEPWEGGKKCDLQLYRPSRRGRDESRKFGAKKEMRENRGRA